MGKQLGTVWYCSPDDYGRCLLLLELWWGQRITVTASITTLLKGLPAMSALELSRDEAPRKQPRTLSAPCAEIISRIFQAISFLEEVRKDLPNQVRQSPARDASEGALASAVTHLTMGAAILLPQEFRAPRTAAEAGAVGSGG